MARIFINKYEMNELKSRFYSISNRITTLESDIVRSINRLDWEVSQKELVRGQILSARKKASELARQSNQLRLFVDKAVNDFSNTDSRIAGMQRESSNWLERIWKGLAGYSSRIYSSLRHDALKLFESVKKAGVLFVNRNIEMATTNISNIKTGLESFKYVAGPVLPFVITEILRNRLQAVHDSKKSTITPKPADQLKKSVNTDPMVSSSNIQQNIVGDPPGEYNDRQKAQYYLNAMGFNIGKNDGILGVKSSSSLIIFQYSQGLRVTGKVDDSTLKKLRECSDGGTSYESIMESNIVKNWKPGIPTISRDDKVNGYLESKNMVAVPAAGGGSAYLEKEAAISYAMMINDIMDYNKTEEAKKNGILDLNKFAAMGSASGNRTYHQQVEAYLNERHGGNDAANPVFNDSKKAEKWIADNWKKYDSHAHWNNVPDELTQKGGALVGHGKSDHGWGLALDMNLKDPGSYGDGKGNATTPEVKWLEKNGNKYGFSGLVTSTNKKGDVYHETWHWNYMK